MIIIHHFLIIEGKMVEVSFDGIFGGNLKGEIS